MIFQQCLVNAQTPAEITYGSVGTETQSAQNTAAFSPVAIYVAQNTAPASIATPVSPVLTAPAIAQPVSSAPVLTGFDPYATQTATSFFTSPAPTGTRPASAVSSLATNPSSNPASSLGQSTAPSNTFSGNFDKFFPETYQAMRRFRELTSAELTYLPGGNKTNDFGLTQLDLRMQFAIPCRFIPNNGANNSGTGSFYIAPGGSLVWWNGPNGGKPEMSKNGFSAFIDAGVQPQFNDVFSINAWGRFGVFSDFHKISSAAFRFQGRLEGLAKISPKTQIVAGVVYLGRERVTIMPTGGMIYQPSEDLIFKLVFPNPKISKRLWQSPKADWWGYANADYCGGTWEIREIGKTDYNDVRLGLGLEFVTQQRIGGYFEFGGSFARELYSHDHQWNKAPTVMYLKTGIIF